ARLSPDCTGSPSHRHNVAIYDAGGSAGSPAAKLAARRCPAGHAASRTFVLVTEDQPALFQVVWRHFDCHPVPRQRLDPVLLHLARGVGNDLVPGVELHAIACIGEDLGYQSFELDQLFFSHGSLQVDRRSALRPLGSVGPGVWTAFAMQKGDPLHALRLATTLRRTRRFLPGALVPAGLSRRITTTGTAAAARAFRSRRGLVDPCRMHARRRSSAAMRRWHRR